MRTVAGGSRVGPPSAEELNVYCFCHLFPVTHPHSPMFVTWKKRSANSSSDDWYLRGCIGTFAARPLKKGLRDFAKISAFGDSRFDPVQQTEVAHLQCTVSLLTDFEEADSVDDWQVR